MECAIAYSLGDLHVWGSACNQFKNENVTKERKVPLPICQMEKEKLPEKLPKLRNRPLLLLCLPAHPRLQRSLLPKKSNLSPSHLYLLSSILYLSRALLIFTMPCNTIPCNTLPCHTIQFHAIFTSPQMLIFKLYQLHTVLCMYPPSMAQYNVISVFTQPTQFPMAVKLKLVYEPH